MEEFDNYKYEKELRENGIKFIAGVDEVGRGPLVGMSENVSKHIWDHGRVR